MKGGPSPWSFQDPTNQAFTIFKWLLKLSQVWLSIQQKREWRITPKIFMEHGLDFYIHILLLRTEAHGLTQM